MARKKKSEIKSNEFSYDVVKSLVEEHGITVDEAVEIVKKFLLTTIKNFLGFKKGEETKYITILEDEKVFKLFLKYEVVTEDNYTDEKTQILFEDAKKINPDLKESDIPEYIDGMVKEGCEPLYLEKEFPYNEIITEKALSAGKSAFIKDIKEYKYGRIYNTFKDREGEFVTGVVELSNNNFTLLKIKDTEGVIAPADKIRGEEYPQGAIVKAIIKEVKAAPKSKNNEYQIELSRADETFIRRLLEIEIPEINQGIIEVKAISRIAGERTKVAVYSKDENVDPIGACIGTKGSRIQNIIQELTRFTPTNVKPEMIDIFEWNDNIFTLVKNVFSPANVVGCMYSNTTINPNLKENDFIKGEKFNSKPLCVVVENDQKSLAIGSRGTNTTLAAKLIKAKNIDIRDVSDMETLGIDYVAETEAFNQDQERIIKERRQAEFLKSSNEAIEAAKAAAEIKDDLDNYYTSEVEEEKDYVELKQEEAAAQQETAEPVVEEVVVEAVKNEELVEEPVQEPVKEEVKPVEKIKRKPLEPKAGYVSKFEDFAGSATKKEEEPKFKKKKKKNDEEYTSYNSEKAVAQYDESVKPVYTEEELDEIEALEEEEEANSWINDDDVDFDEYEEYYDEKD